MQLGDLRWCSNLYFFEVDKPGIHADRLFAFIIIVSLGIFNCSLSVYCIVYFTKVACIKNKADISAFAA